MLNKRNTGLLVIDIQGKLATIVDNSDALISSTIALVKGAKILNLPILCLEQLPEKLGSTTPEIASALVPIKAIRKHTFSGVGCSEFVDAINHSNVDTWLVCGVEAHICVYQTVADLLAMGQNVHVVIDCISSRVPVNKELALSALQKKGAYITSVEMCLYELIGDSLLPEFREILKLIK